MGAIVFLLSFWGLIIAAFKGDGKTFLAIALLCTAFFVLKK